MSRPRAGPTPTYGQADGGPEDLAPGETPSSTPATQGLPLGLCPRSVPSPILPLCAQASCPAHCSPGQPLLSLCLAVPALLVYRSQYPWFALPAGSPGSSLSLEPSTGPSPSGTPCSPPRVLGLPTGHHRHELCSLGPGSSPCPGSALQGTGESGASGCRAQQLSRAEASVSRPCPRQQLSLGQVTLCLSFLLRQAGTKVGSHVWQGLAEGGLCSALAWHRARTQRGKPSQLLVLVVTVTVVIILSWVPGGAGLRHDREQTHPGVCPGVGPGLETARKGPIRAAGHSQTSKGPPGSLTGDVRGRTLRPTEEKEGLPGPPVPRVTRETHNPVLFPYGATSGCPLPAPAPGRKLLGKEHGGHLQSRSPHGAAETAALEVPPEGRGLCGHCVWGLQGAHSSRFCNQ